MEDLLPIGSIVELTDRRRKMIIGYLPSKPNDKEFYDYICCNSKIGLRKEKIKLKPRIDYSYINKEDIKDVLYVGCQDNEFLIAKLTFDKVKSRMLEARETNTILTNEELDELYGKAFSEIKSEIEKMMDSNKENKNEG